MFFIKFESLLWFESLIVTTVEVYKFHTLINRNKKKQIEITNWGEGVVIVWNSISQISFNWGGGGNSSDGGGGCKAKIWNLEICYWPSIASFEKGKYYPNNWRF